VAYAGTLWYTTYQLTQLKHTQTKYNMNQDNRPAGKKPTIQPIPKADRMAKRWIMGKRRARNSRQQLDNESIESHYHFILAKAKEWLSGNNQLVFERDYRFDNSEDAFALHAFISSSFYLYIECGFDFNYRVQYAFNDCKFEDELRRLLRPCPLNTAASQVRLKPDFNTFYRKVLAIQDERYVYYLQA